MHLFIESHFFVRDALVALYINGSHFAENSIVTFFTYIFLIIKILLKLPAKNRIIRKISITILIGVFEFYFLYF